MAQVALVAQDEFILGLVRATLPSAQEATNLVEVMRARRLAYAWRRLSLVSLLSLYDVQVTETSGTVSSVGSDGAKIRALMRAEWLNVAMLAEAPPRDVQVGVLHERVPITGFSLARGDGPAVVAISPFRFGTSMN